MGIRFHDQKSSYFISSINTEFALGKSKVSTQNAKSLILRFCNKDKDFALWLYFQLINHGYPAWCELINSEPGDYTDVMAQDLIKNNAAKYLFVLSDLSNVDAKLLQELRFAYEVMRSKRLAGFVVPIQVIDLPDADRTILLQGTSPIDFSKGWPRGLDDLLKYLEKSGVVKDDELSPSKTNDLWRLQFSAEKGLKNEEEELVSNWFPIQLPEFIYFHELHRNSVGLLAVLTDNLQFPALQHNIYLITFARAEDFAGKLGFNISITDTTEIKIQDFLAGNYDQRLAKQDLSWNFVMELLNDAWDKYFSHTKLKKYFLANNRISYYFPIGFSERGDNKAYYQSVEDKRSWRSLAGKHKSNYWHFGIQGRAMLHPIPAYLVKSHALASSDGINIWQSKEKLHTARRRWFKNWWNVEWRDRLLAAMSYLSNNSGFVEIPVGTDRCMSVSSSPLVFISPVKYINSRDAILDIEVDDENLSENEEVDEEFDDDLPEDEDL